MQDGKGHTYRETWSRKSHRTSFCRNERELYKNFKKTRLIFLTGDETTLAYALGGDSLHPRTGMRRDGIGLPGYAEMWAGSERYKCVPDMGEVWKWQPLCFEWGGISRNIYEGKATTPKGKRMPKPEETFCLTSP